MKNTVNFKSLKMDSFLYRIYTFKDININCNQSAPSAPRPYYACIGKNPVIFDFAVIILGQKTHTLQKSPPLRFSFRCVILALFHKCKGSDC